MRPPSQPSPAGDWVGFRKQALPLLDAHLGHLHGHHRLEDQHYFPAMRRAEPRLDKGFDLLAADHERIDASVRELQRLRTLLAHASPAEAAAWQCAHDMARALPVCGTLLTRQPCNSASDRPDSQEQQKVFHPWLLPKATPDN